ncbi:hypothetical protein FIE12Z_7914 [Fusarium flagelliforme]|uniref:Uncharacterized protein n=1 Tax=Fusarium flagelliforme TaxID=2675880 RepID=A0A395ML00_9HYPO|nr:hypothetical protein FIE12Z_7914 [Fusarium flagelliforme]
MIFSDYSHSSNDTLPPTSPLLQPVQPRLKPEAPDESDDDTDIEDVVDLVSGHLPYNNLTRLDRKRPRGTKPDRLRKKRRDAGWKDWSLVHNMSANDPEIARAAAREGLPPDYPLPVSSKIGRPRKRRVLPLSASGSLGIARVFHACADSGSDENIISLEAVRQMQLDVQPNSSKEFALANGKILKATGFVKLDCRFEVGTPLPSTTLACVFYVFNTLAVPMIIGMDFLVQTETLTKHTDRLIEQVVSDMQALRVNSIGSSKQSAPCRLNDYNGYTVIDTGSDLNFIHPRVLERGHFDLEFASVYLEFADCSVGQASGLIDVTFAIGHDNGPYSLEIPMEPVREEFYVLDDLDMDVLIGHDTIESLGVMTAHLDSLLHTSFESGVNIIRAIGKLEGRFKTFLAHVSPSLGRNSGKLDRFRVFDLLTKNQIPSLSQVYLLNLKLNESMHSKRKDH